MQLVLFLVAIGCANAAPLDQIVGRWRSLETSKGGIGEIYQFHANGDVDYSPGAVVETTYRIEGDQLWIHDANADGSEQKLKINWIGENKFRLEAQSGSTGATAVSELTRNGERRDSKNPVIGEWTGTQDMRGHKVPMIWLFYSERKSLFLMPFTPQHGHYTVQGSTLLIELSTNTIEKKFQINGDVLTIADPNGTGQSRLARF